MGTESRIWEIGDLLFRIRLSGGGTASFWDGMFPDYRVEANPDHVHAELVAEPVPAGREAPDFVTVNENGGTVERLSEGSFRYRHVDLMGDLTNSERGCEGHFWIREHVSAVSRLLVLALAHAGPRNGRLLLHASAVEFEGRGYVFAGDSGAGKTTIATRLNHRGRTLSVDRTLLVPNGSGGWQVCATPFSDYEGIGRPRPGAPLGALLFLEQAPHHQLCSVSTAASVRQILKNTTSLARDSDDDMLVLELAGRLAESVPCGVLRFALDTGFWSLLTDASNGFGSLR